MPPHDPFGFAGALIDAQIQVGEPVGEGGFSVVYRAHHVGLDEPVALKCLKIPGGLGPKVIDGVVERFRAESRISYRLSQGNLDIVRSVSSGAAHSPATGELVPYIALEWLDGPSLAQDLKRRRAEGLKGRPFGEVIDVLEPAALALDYAHKQGVVHRDVKPGNLVLNKTREGGTRIKVLDFGLAKVIDPDGIGLVATSQTVTSVILCSPGYGAPEQFDSSLGPIGSYTDVYSFALIVLEMLRDEKVRPSASVAMAAKQALTGKPVSPLALGLMVSPAMDALFQRTVQTDKTKRPKDLGEFWTELKQHASARASAAPAPPRDDVQPSPLSFSAPGIQKAPEVPQVTRPMPRPTRPADGASSAKDAAASASKGPLPADPPAMQGTMIMAARPAIPQKASPPVVPVTAPMQAMPVIAHGVVSPPVEDDLLATRVADGSTLASPVPQRPSGPPRPAPPPPAAGAPPPGGVVAAPGPAPGANPPRRSRLMVAVLVILSLTVFSALIMTAGYFAHSWFAAHRGE